MSKPSEGAKDSRRWRALVLLAVAELLAMSLWFSASAVVPALRAEWRLTESAAGWLTLSVQLGFVAGTLLSALLNLPDVLSSRRLFTLCALLGAIVNACFGLFAESFGVGVALRFFVGFFLAGVYPPGIERRQKKAKNAQNLYQRIRFPSSIGGIGILKVYKEVRV